MSIGAMILSIVLTDIDAKFGGAIAAHVDGLYTFGPEGARAILSTIASSMITVAGLTFSITMLTLQLASSQFGPRLLRNFMRDRGNQLVLGTFVANFIYCLLVLRVVRGINDEHFVPHISVAFGVLLALAGIAVLIYFIHHIATSIRIETLLAQLSNETCEAIDRLFPQVEAESGVGDSAASARIRSHAQAADMAEIFLPRSGYIQRIDHDALVEEAREGDVVVRLEVTPGEFAMPTRPIARVYPANHVDDAMRERLAGHFATGAERTPHQDLEFSLRRIVEIAQRALSPGVNDPTTALYCIDRLGEIFARFAVRSAAKDHRADKDGKLRLITPAPSFDNLSCQSFAAVARYGLGDADVILALIAEAKRVSNLRPTPSLPLLALCEDIRRASLAQLSLASDQTRLKPPRSTGLQA